MRDFSIIFKGDNLRYLVELRGSQYSRLFYNKVSIILFELGRYLSFYSPRIYFAESFMILLFPFWLFGIFDIISKREWNVFRYLLIAGIPVYLIDKRDVVSTLPISIIYGYIIFVGFRFVLNKWQKLK